MGFKSKAQERMMFAKHPEIAKRWIKKYGQPKNLPEHVAAQAHAAHRKKHKHKR